MEPTQQKLWGGRFSGNASSEMEKFNRSIMYDRLLWREDLEGSAAYAQALHASGLIDLEEREALLRGIDEIKREWENDAFKIHLDIDEDIHTANERRLRELIGASNANKLHTGRSRNDQVATDVRLWMRRAGARLIDSLKELIETLTLRAQQDIELIMCGYTHLQRAQPIRWSHWLLSFAWALRRDYERFQQALERCNVLPLGSGALTGNPFGIDRPWLARELGFSSASFNSIDATCDRDFILEFMFCAHSCMIHLSRMAEDLIVYSSKEFGFVTLADAYSTGSSLMPQKKNPDSLELIRGKAGRVFGNLAGLSMTCKGIPTAYNKDLQEDKEPLFDTTRTLESVLKIAGGLISTLATNRDRMEDALSVDMLATDVAYYLVRKGMPFRDAHHKAGEVIQLAESKGCGIDSLSTESLRTLSPLFADDVANLWQFEASVEQYVAQGGTSRSAVQQQIDELKKWSRSIQ